MPGRGNTPAQGYRYGFNGKENDNEVKGNGNSLDYGARIYDSRLGRWLSIDPLANTYAGYTPFNFTLNNPILFIDPDGMKVEYHREEGVSRKQFRQFKRDIKNIRSNSESYNAMYKDLKGSEHTYVFNATKEQGGENKEVGGKTMINVGLNSNFGDANVRHSVFGNIAHETGHAWLKDNGLEINFPPLPKGGILDSKQESINKNNDWIDKVTSIKNTSETNAMHIENIVRTELGNSTFSDFKGIGLNNTYQGGFGIKLEVTTEGFLKKSTTFINLDALKAPHTATYYKETKKFNIYNEFNIKPKSK